MKVQLNRRAMLTGTIAIAAAALPIVAHAATHNEDAELFDLFRQWEKGKALETSFGAEHTSMESLAQANQPTIPPELLQPIDGLPASEKPDPKQGWTIDELERVASLTEVSKFTRIKTDNGFDLRSVDEPVPDTARVKAQELLAIKKSYDAQYDAVWEEADRGQKRFDAIVSDNTDLLDLLAATPANTVQGLLAKCHICQIEKLFVSYMDFPRMAQSIVEDIQRLAPQLTAKV